MTRVLLALALAAGVAFTAPATTAYADHCGDDTLQQPCETCITQTGEKLVCVPVDPHLPPL